MAKRLIFSTGSPNDQGGIIPNDVIDFSRYGKNPVMLKEHRWGDDPLGKMTDIKMINGKWTGVPFFHEETKESTEAAGMYRKDCLNAASIGGFAVWKKDPVTQDYKRDSNGFRIAEKYYLYEVSLVGLPSNEDAVGVDESKLSAHFYEEAEYELIEPELLTLSSKFNYGNIMYIKKKPGEAGYDPKIDGPDAAEPSTNAANPAAGAEPSTSAAQVTTDVNQLPGIIQQAIKSGMSVTFSAVPPTATHTTTSTPTAKPAVSSEIPGVNVATETQPEPIGLKAKTAAEKFKAMQTAQSAAGKAVLRVEECKNASEDAPGDEMKASALKSAQDNASRLIQLAATAEADYNKAKDEAEEEAQSAIQKSTNSAGARFHMQYQPAVPDNNNAPALLTSAEATAKLNLAVAPSFKAKVMKDSQGVTFTRLNSSKADENDRNLLKRVFHTNRKTTDQVNVADHLVVLNSIANDPRLRAIWEKARMHNVKAGEVAGMRNNYRGQRGMSMETLSADMNAGRVQYWNRSSGNMDNLTLLTSTDNALAAPALNTIEWLSLAIFELFPTTTWKSSIPIFAADMTSRNTGTIWANVTADPAIYKGNQPAPANDYIYTDQAVSLALTPYYLQPMVWNPLYMHQLRYDQQATGWAQAFAKWNSVMDDNLIYTVASTVPQAAIVGSSGLSGYQAVPNQFNIPASGAQNKFYWSPNYAGNLFTPSLNDVIALEQIFRNQNFELEREKAVFVMDPIMERYVAQDPETKSLLTAHISRDGESFIGYKHSIFDVRSRVAVYDPTTQQVKDINAAIPATAQSAGLYFLPSQLAMALGMLDVFMVQDPSVYGYRMSADIRIGVAPLRYNFLGTALYYYGLGNV